MCTERFKSHLLSNSMWSESVFLPLSHKSGLQTSKIPVASQELPPYVCIAYEHPIPADGTWRTHGALGDPHRAAATQLCRQLPGRRRAAWWRNEQAVPCY